MEPGKIPHEIRHGELAQLRILPFQPYYGTHDATSLFVIVISYLYQWLGDVGRPGALPAQRRGGAALDRPVGRPRPRRLPGVQDPLDARLLQPGLEGRRRRHPARRRLARAAAARAVRAPGLRLRREAADGRHLRDPRATRARARACAPGARAVRPLQRRVLVGGRGDLLPRPRRRQASRSRASPPTPGTAWRAASSRRSGRAGSSSA